MKVKHGSLLHLRHLKGRIPKEYAANGPQILDAILWHLKGPIPDDDEGPFEASSRTALAVASLAALADVAHWLCSEKAKTHVSGATSLSTLLRAAEDYTTCALNLIATTTTGNGMLQLYHTISLLFHRLLKANHRLLSVLAQSPSMLDIAITFWTALYRGSPLLYPNGKTME